MKIRSLICVLLLLAAGLRAQDSSTGGNKITLVDVAANVVDIIHNGQTKAYHFAMIAEITVNGAKATVRELAAGMVVDSMTLADPTTIRKLDAVSVSAEPSPANSYDQAADTDAADPKLSKAEKEEVAKKLAGTYWTYRFKGQDHPERFWFRLNADGTVTAGWHNMAGKWEVVGDLTIKVQILGGQISRNHSEVMRFNSELTKSGPHERITELTPDMVAKVSVPTEPRQAGRAAAVPAVTSGTQQSASEIVKANHSNLVIVRGKDAGGSGFIATMGGANFLVTNAHVAVAAQNAVFTTLDNSVLKGGSPTVAVGEDVFRMAMPAGGKPFEIMQAVDENAAIGDAVVVLGNAEAAGVVNTLIGRIVGIGPNLVEIDAPIVPGNSGSPIVHLKSGKVIGVATYLVVRKYDVTTHEKMQAPVVRRFGYRLDTVKAWQSVNWSIFYEQAAEMKNIEDLTKAFFDFFLDIEVNGKVTSGRHTHPVIKRHIDMWLNDRSRSLSPSGMKAVDANFLSFLKTACQTDMTAARQNLTYDYFQRELANQQLYRDGMAKAFGEIIARIRN